MTVKPAADFSIATKKAKEKTESSICWEKLTIKFLYNRNTFYKVEQSKWVFR